nr:hypothetical protein KitaXyl93_62020 [Kitasatospora sp. Xyl93]
MTTTSGRHSGVDAAFDRSNGTAEPDGPENGPEPGGGPGLGGGPGPEADPAAESGPTPGRQARPRKRQRPARPHEEVPSCGRAGLGVSRAHVHCAAITRSSGHPT